MSRRFACFILFLFSVSGLAVAAHAQEQGDPLSPDEIQQIRDNKTNPNDRIKLYLKFIDERLDSIKQLTGTGKTAKEKADIHDKLEEFTRLCDELQDNLDTYDEAHADIRKSLKDLVADSARWPTQLTAIGADPSYDFSQKTAMEAAKSAADEAHQLSLSQQVYFDAHKKERGGTGNGPS
jgi:predicted  nucleic acid-binding Zn-ribbon protein